MPNLLHVEGLYTHFQSTQHRITAVDGLSFSIAENEVLGLVGESGSGKSITALSLLQLLPSTATSSAAVLTYRGEALLSASPKRLREIRGKEIGLIFQNPLAALNPVFTIGEQLIETLTIRGGLSKSDAKARAIALLEQVNIPDAGRRLGDYPHQFSLGMCQRIVIALTLSLEPKLLIADEPTASLDVTVQAQVMALLKDIQRQHNMSMLLISHDLGIIAQNCDRVMVMYLGRIVETGTPNDIFLNPKHPYTQALIRAIPSTDPRQKHIFDALKGEIPSPLAIPTGCRFHTRCPVAESRCRQEDPILRPCGDNGHVAACVLV
jgi:oligopeptide/dipeptide ABC transporter ATP-binding protein